MLRPISVSILYLLATPAATAPIVLQLGDVHASNRGGGHGVMVKTVAQPSVHRQESLGSIVQEAASAYGIDPYLIIAIIHVESNFIAHARSPKGAIGLMQVMPATARQYGDYDLYQPKDNIMVGTRHFSYLMRRYGSIPHALAAYNAGQGNVDKYKGIPPFGETQAYVKKVLASYKAAQQHGKDSTGYTGADSQPSATTPSRRPIIINL